MVTDIRFSKCYESGFSNVQISHTVSFKCRDKKLIEDIRVWVNKEIKFSDPTIATFIGNEHAEWHIAFPLRYYDYLLAQFLIKFAS